MQWVVWGMRWQDRCSGVLRLEGRGTRTVRWGSVFVLGLRYRTGVVGFSLGGRRYGTRYPS